MSRRFPFKRERLNASYFCLQLADRFTHAKINPQNDFFPLHSHVSNFTSRAREKATCTTVVAQGKSATRTAKTIVLSYTCLELYLHSIDLVEYAPFPREYSLFAFIRGFFKVIVSPLGKKALHHRCAEQTLHKISMTRSARLAANPPIFPFLPKNQILGIRWRSSFHATVRAG